MIDGSKSENKQILWEMSVLLTAPTLTALHEHVFGEKKIKPHIRFSSWKPVDQPVWVCECQISATANIFCVESKGQRGAAGGNAALPHLHSRLCSCKNVWKLFPPLNLEPQTNFNSL